MNLMGPPDPNWGESGIDSTGRRRLVCPCCGGWLDWRGRHQCLPSAGGCQPGCTHKPVPALSLREETVPTDWHFPIDQSPVLCAKCLTPVPDGRDCPVCRPKRVGRYVPGVGLVTATTPELLERAVQVATAQAVADLLAEAAPGPPRYPVIIPLEPHRYVPPAPRPLPGIEHGTYAHRARNLGQVQALIVTTLTVTTALSEPHNWAAAGRMIGVLLFLTQLLHWYIWSRRNDL